MLATRVLVDTPVTTDPLPGGLFKTVNVIETSDPHIALGGVEYIPEPNCGDAVGFWPGSACAAPPSPVYTGSLAALAGTTTDVTVTVTGGIYPLGDYVVTLENVDDDIATLVPYTSGGVFTLAAVETTGATGKPPYILVVTSPDGTRTSSAEATPGVAVVTLVFPAGPTVFKEYNGVPDPVGADAFTVYAGVKCFFDPTDPFFQARANRSLELGEESAVEQHLWDTVLPGSAVALDASYDGDLFAVETLMRQRYRGTPVFHIDLYTAQKVFGIYPVGLSQIIGVDDTFRTAAGSLVVIGAGYGARVTAAAAPTATGTVYVTGMLNVYRTPVVGNNAALLELNEFGAIAERDYLVVADCAIYSFQSAA